MKPTYPAWHILSGRAYTPAAATDIRETIAKARQKLVKPGNVQPIKRVKAI